MNFNIYLDDETGQQLNQLAQRARESRNTLMRQAVSDWLNKHDWVFCPIVTTDSGTARKSVTIDQNERSRWPEYAMTKPISPMKCLHSRVWRACRGFKRWYRRTNFSRGSQRSGTLARPLWYVQFILGFLLYRHSKLTTF